jgi:hypothetical protein
MSQALDSYAERTSCYAGLLILKKKIPQIIKDFSNIDRRRMWWDKTG